MADTIYHGRYTATLDGDFVVFLIGARIPTSYLWRAKWIGDAMGAMRDELRAKPESGFLGDERFYRLFPLEIVYTMYWRSFDHLERFSRTRDDLHYPAWLRFYREVGMSSKIGIWHETYMVRANEYECIYGNMPKFGLANVTGAQHRSLKDMSRARDRSGQDDKPETVPAPESILSIPQ